MANKREIQEINASSMADIAFLLLIFFLVATTMNVDTGIARQLPPIPPENTQLENIDVRKRNLLPVFVNMYDQILVNRQPLDITQLKDKVKEFILNPTDAEDMPEKTITEIALPDGGTWSFPVTKGVVSLTNDQGTSYDLYVQVQNELTRAYNEMREDLSRQRFGKGFMELEEAESEVIREAIPQQISEGELKNAGGN